MQNGMKANPEESLRRALAELADQTGSGVASDRVRQELQRQVGARVYRRWAFAALATAAALSAVFFGITTRPAQLVRPSPPRTLALQARTPGASTTAAQAVEGDAFEAVAAPLPVRPKRGHAGRKPKAIGEWRKGEIALSPWYYNTALPPAAHSVLVRSEVDAPTAMRFGVMSAGHTAPVEILFGEDGLPRAMRFVRHLATQKN
jgi:hypothetical protein